MLLIYVGLVKLLVFFIGVVVVSLVVAPWVWNCIFVKPKGLGGSFSLRVEARYWVLCVFLW